MATVRMLIDGKLVGGENEDFDVINPATEEVFQKCPSASESQVEAAIQAAVKAGPSWARTSIEDRKKCLAALTEKIQEHLEDLAKTVTQEQGKVLPFSKGCVAACLSGYVLAKCQGYENEVDVYKDTDVEKIETRRVPVGVIACITPWNFPIFSSVQKWAPALTLGNTVVLKPSPFTPISMLKIAALAVDIFPPGVLNIISGPDDPHIVKFNIGAILSQHPAINKVSFTGSVPTGKRINVSAAPDMKRVTLECGGNDAAIVRADADIKATAQGVCAAAFGNSGQVCVAAKRIYVHESIKEEFTAECVKVVEGFKFGNGLEEGVTHGPLSNKQQLNIVADLVEDAKKNGAVIVTGGEALDQRGFFYKPTIITNVTEGVRIVDEEQFGPVMPIIGFSDDDDAIVRANTGNFGLGGSVWGSDIAAANEMATQIKAGTVWVNQHSNLTGAPFGGFKWSGIGRELGKSDVAAYTELQTFRFAK